MKDLFTRSKLNPVLRPEHTDWWKIYNPGAAIDEAGRVHLFPRVIKKEADWHSRIAHTVSTDGEHFEWNPGTLLEREGPSELRGLEDPRITKICDTYYMAFAAYDGKSVHLHTATAKDLNGPWHRQGSALPDFDFVQSGGKRFRWEHGKPVERTTSERGTKWSKAGALFPQKFGDKFYLLFGEYDIWLATSDDGITFEAKKDIFIGPRPGTDYFDNTFVETGPPPILTKKGWLVLYHGIDHEFRYRLGFVILDNNDPSKILYRSDKPIFGPQEDYETGRAGMKSFIDVLTGGINALVKLDSKELAAFYEKNRKENLMPQVTFCPGAVVRDENLWLYYGAGDTSICTAWAPLKNILALVP